MKRALPLILFAALSVFASAQTTLATIPQQNRGPFTNQKLPSNGYLIPADANQITIATQIALADLQNSANSLTIDMEASDDGGVTYNHCLADNGDTTCAGFTWVGGGTDKSGNPVTISPTMVFDCAGLRGLLARLSITIGRRMSIGATVTEQ